MIKTISKPRVKKIKPENIMKLKEKLEIYYQPFEDRTMEELKGRYNVSKTKLKDKIQLLKQKGHTIKKMNRKIDRLKLTLNIVELLQFIVKKQFMSEKNRKDINTIISNLKDMNYDELVKQYKILKQAKSRILGG